MQAPIFGPTGEIGHPHNRALVVIDSEVVRLTPGLLERISQYGEAYGSVMSFVSPPPF